jgi:hypothetical protein
MDKEEEEEGTRRICIWIAKVKPSCIDFRESENSLHGSTANEQRDSHTYS